jgi:nucleotide-binding universal stress UspA family protein
LKRETRKQLNLPRPGRIIELAPGEPFPGGEGNLPTPRVILHPTDFSEHSRQGFELACGISRDCGSRLIVLNVAEPARVSGLGMAPTPPLPKGYRGAWESRLRLVQPAEPDVRVEHRLEEGNAADEILRVARETACDLIVMGTRGHTGLRRLLQGSVARKVAQGAPCPVLAVKMPPAGVARVPDVVTEKSIALGPPKFREHPSDPRRIRFAGIDTWEKTR